MSRPRCPTVCPNRGNQTCHTPGCATYLQVLDWNAARRAYEQAQNIGCDIAARSVRRAEKRRNQP